MNRPSFQRAHIHAPRHLGEAIADRVTAFSGSFVFLGLHACWWGLWIGLRLEPFPFGLLTMLLSLEAIILSTLVLMSQAREGRKNAARDDVESAEVTAMYALTREVHQINMQQLQILELLRGPDAPAPIPMAIRCGGYTFAGQEASHHAA